VEREVLEARKLDVEQRYGTWSAHNLQLAGDLYTIVPEAGWNQAARLRRVVQLVSGLARKPIGELRMLDLGALEGLFSVEFARRGAEVVAVEGREANIEKIRLAKDALGLDHLELRQEDVRSLAVERHGEFDAVLCLGILCLLDAEEAFAFIDQLYRVCGDVLVIEADIALVPNATHVHRGRRYAGAVSPGEPPDADPLDPEVRWTAMGNPRSFRLTGVSLANALADAGFPLVMEGHVPALSYARAGTVTYVALKRERTDVVAVPAFAGQPQDRLAEKPVPFTAALAGRARPLVRRVVPASLRPAAGRLAARILGSP
jgi:SAM-dependent methyltransferase